MTVQTPSYTVQYLVNTSNNLLSSEQSIGGGGISFASDANSVAVGETVSVLYQGEVIDTTNYVYMGTSDTGGIFVQVGSNLLYLTTETGLFRTEAPTLQAVPLCFAAGTRIATPAGGINVEDLRAGAVILTADGGTTVVNWIGRQTLATVFADAARVCPIRISAGALAAGVPARDLLVTGDHGLVFDEAIVHASALVNGTTITRVAKSELETLVTYFHIETEGHAVILAEGAAAETFIDNAGREKFDNFAEFVAMYGAEQDDIEPMTLPRAKTAREVPAAIKARIAARAVTLAGNVAHAI